MFSDRIYMTFLSFLCRWIFPGWSPGPVHRHHQWEEPRRRCRPLLLAPTQQAGDLKPAGFLGPFSHANTTFLVRHGKASNKQCTKLMTCFSWSPTLLWISPVSRLTATAILSFPTGQFHFLAIIHF